MLYHYTSLDTIVQILKNKQIKFNSLANCDDLDEAESADVRQVGRFVYVSCWTTEQQESIPMWTQYSHDMSGVRLGMVVNPFEVKEYQGTNGIIRTALNLELFERDNKMMFVADQPKMVSVEYTEDEAKLIPNILIESSEGATERIIKGTAHSDQTSISIDPIGKYKRPCWSFQKEVRYKIFGTPMGMLETASLENPKLAFEKHRELFRRIFDPVYQPFYKALYVDLSQEAIDSSEILIGPRMTDSQEILLRAFLEQYGYKGAIKKSELRVR